MNAKYFFKHTHTVGYEREMEKERRGEKGRANTIAL